MRIEYAYLSRFKDDLWAQLTSAAIEDGSLPSGGQDIKTIMDTWTLQKGLPVVNVARTSATSATADQARFLLGPADPADPLPYKWWVPISYAGETRSPSSFSRVRCL